jgi:ribosome-associated heat shock protein Hsp15
VLDVTENRIGAKLVPQYFDNITPPEEYELLELNKISGFVNRAKGKGRPTKKERRELDDFTGSEQDARFTFDFDEKWDEEG